MLNNTRVITVNNLNNFYEIPEPYELMKNIGVSYIICIDPTLKNGITNKIEAKRFFINNPIIFKLYLKEIISMNILPNNFYMFIDQILLEIKNKNMVNLVHSYWSDMIHNK
jgi:hypothetical protein